MYWSVSRLDPGDVSAHARAAKCKALVILAIIYFARVAGSVWGVEANIRVHTSVHLLVRLDERSL